jgi:hypothetical protein
LDNQTDTKNPLKKQFYKNILKKFI